VGICLQELFQMAGCGFAVHHGCPPYHFLSCLQIQRAVEVYLLSARMQSHQRRLAPECPDRGGGGLQVESRFIFRQEDGLRRFLSDVG
jgi:hypothetical protein